MNNLNNNNFSFLRILVNYDDYWDFFISRDSIVGNTISDDGSSLYDKCLISYIDSNCSDGNLLISKSKYTFSNSISLGINFENIGYCGMDNGLIPFRRDMNNNRTFLDKYINSEYKIEEGDISLKLHKVSGGTNLYEYPITVLKDKIKFNGGFYQGLFKTECDEYQVLPSKLESGDEWCFEFVLNKTEFEKESNKTLNDKYPNNKGIFFYIGARAENKWVYWYNDDEDECLALSPSDYIEDVETTKYDYKITNMLNPNPTFIDYDEFAMDDYLSFKYYSPLEYENNSVNDGDFFMDDTLPTINESKEHKVIGWCCSMFSEYDTPIYNCCGRIVGYEQNRKHSGSSESYQKYDACCGEHNFILSENDLVHSNKFLSRYDFFGDDYLSDIDTIDNTNDYLEEDLDISNFGFETSGGLKLNTNQYFIETDNKFLLFDRTCDGFDVCNWHEGNVVRYIGNRNSFKDNLFLLMNQTCTGYTACSIDELRNKQVTEYNIYNDLYNNALAFRMTDKGEIGYRYITLNCEKENNIEVKEAYSKEGVVKENEWYIVDVKIKSMFGKMKLYFYVNGNLVFISDELQNLDLRKLKEADEKQESVPFNISIGGGTQGLAETILPNYMLDPYRTYPLEANFAGSFIGYIKSFRFYDCDIESINIKNNLKFDMKEME